MLMAVGRKIRMLAGALAAGLAGLATVTGPAPESFNAWALRRAAQTSKDVGGRSKGGTVAADKRAARKARNVARNKAAHRG